MGKIKTISTANEECKLQVLVDDEHADQAQQNDGQAVMVFRIALPLLRCSADEIGHQRLCGVF
jgi:hypothetical protein